jgi:preprotein translocase subunit SecY
VASQFSNITKIPELQKRIVFTLALLAVYRIGCFITTPGVDRRVMAERFTGGGRGDGAEGFLNLFNFFSGGALEQMSIFALGIMPYISASIIFQLLGIVVPAVDRMQKEGEQGRRKINQYTRLATIAIAVVQGMAMSFFLQSIDASQSGTLITMQDPWSFRLLTVLSLTTGSIFIMWLGEQISERGIGNGISLLIFSGIVARLPLGVIATWEQVRSGGASGGGLSAFQLLLLIIVIFSSIALICFFERAQRRIPIQYAKRLVGRQVYAGQSSFLPLKVNTAGVIPPIFASSLLLFPATIANYFNDVEWIKSITSVLSPGQWQYMVVYVTLIIFFCYFYTAVVFNPVDVADNLKKNQASIPGIKPGKLTAEYIDRVLGRITFAGAVYIAAVCILPEILINKFQVQFYFGGTALLIVVSVSLDTVQQIETMLITRHYDGFSAQGGPRLRHRAETGAPLDNGTPTSGASDDTVPEDSTLSKPSPEDTSKS